jgi:hypothetical protein
MPVTLWIRGPTSFARVIMRVRSALPPSHTSCSARLLRLLPSARQVQSRREGTIFTSPLPLNAKCPLVASYVGGRFGEAHIAEEPFMCLHRVVGINLKMYYG